MDAPATQAPPDPAGLVASRTRLLAAAILASAMGFIDGSVTAIAVTAMRADLGASLAQAQWIGNGYMLTLAALVLAGGAAGDRFGTARAFRWGIGGFVAASTLCAAAPTANLLVAARVLQGAAAALMVPGSLALIARAFPAPERGRAIGTWAAASALTTAMGPLLGGLLLTAGDPAWRLIFALNLPLGLAALRLLRAAPAERGRPDRPLDWPGAALATGGLGLLAAGLTDARPLLALAGLVALAAFLAWEARAPAPMMPLRLWRDRAFALANLATLLLYFALSAVLFFLPMLLEAGWGLSPLLASLAFAPLSALIFLLSGRFGALADRVGPGPLVAGGAGVVALAYGALALAVGAERFWAGVMPPMALAGLGMAMVVAPLSAAVMGGAGEDGGAASGINNAVSRVAGLLAVSAMGGVAAWAYAAAGGPLSYGAPGGAAGHAAAMTRAFSVVAGTAAALAAVSALAALAIPRPAQQPREAA